MNFVKPKFWDKNQISFLAILFLPITLLIKLLYFLKRNLTVNRKCPMPIICVGNIYLGGTGKTPLCVEIFSILKNLSKNPAFIRKKYNSFQDEVDLLKNKGSVYQSSKRINAINKAGNDGANVAILDDGFQDFSISKDFSIVCFNEKQWIGNGMTIPSGPLRESLSALKRANCVMINGKKNLNIENIILEKNKKIKIFYINYKPQNINKFKDKKIIAFAGIGNPINFFKLLKENNINIIKEIEFPDHYYYTKKELENLIEESENNDAILLTTEKDYFRIAENYKKKISYLKIDCKIDSKNQLTEELKKII